MATQTFPFDSTSSPARSLGRSVGAVAAGLVATFAVTTATDLAMQAAGLFPAYGGPPMASRLFVLAFAYRFVFDVAGSALAARLAPSRPLRHALVLGGIGLALSVAGAIAMWDAGPAWYSLGIAASALPCAWLGGRLGGRARPVAIGSRATA